jgi:hypothetical protein
VPPAALDAVLTFSRADAAAGVSSTVLTLARSVTEISMIRWKTLAAVLMVGTALTAGVGGRYFAGASAQPPVGNDNKPAKPTDPNAPAVIRRDMTGTTNYFPTTDPLAAPPGLTATALSGARAAWEYEVVILRPDARGELNALGKDGWELVSVDRATNGVATAYLKRPAAPSTTTTSTASSGTSTSTTTGSGSSSFVPSGLRSNSSNSSGSSGSTGSSTAGNPTTILPTQPTKPGASDENFGVVRLQRLSAPAAAAVLKELYQGRAGFEGVIVEAETNSLVIKGSAAMVKRVKTTIEKLEAEKEEPNPNRQ